MKIAKYVLPFLISNVAFAQSYYPTNHTVTCGHTVIVKGKSTEVNVVQETNVKMFRFLAEGDNMFIVIFKEDNSKPKSFLLSDNEVCSVGKTK